MSITRRKLLAGSAAAAATAAVGSRLDTAALARWSERPRVAWAAGRSAAMPAPSAELHLLNRASFGPTFEEFQRVKEIGRDAWIEEQLAPERIDDSTTDSGLAQLTSLAWNEVEIKTNWGKKKNIRNELVAGAMYRMVGSTKQLYEVMVDHFSCHFSIYHIEEFISAVKTIDDRVVVRANALGQFRDMLHASAQSLAMMRYLNTFQNTRSGPNENYGREVMELHTLGVKGGYTEADVKQVARCFTGWNRRDDNWAFDFRAADHDTSQKTVLGKVIQSNGAAEGHEVLDILVDHPSCAKHVARRIVRRMVADEPVEALVDKMAAAWGSDGDIRAMLRVLLNSPEFSQANAALGVATMVTPHYIGGPAKIKRPLEMWTSTLRVLGVDPAFMLDVPPDAYEGDAGDANYADRAERYLQLMDQVPFRWFAPNGYPDQGSWWGGMHVMVSRWNYTLAVLENRLNGITLDLYGRMSEDGVGNLAGEVVDYWIERVLMRPVLPEDRDALIEFLNRGLGQRVAPELIAERLPMLVCLMLDSPYFQWR